MLKVRGLSIGSSIISWWCIQYYISCCVVQSYRAWWLKKNFKPPISCSWSALVSIIRDAGEIWSREKLLPPWIVTACANRDSFRNSGAGNCGQYVTTKRDEWIRAISLDADGLCKATADFINAIAKSDGEWELKSASNQLLITKKPPVCPFGEEKCGVWLY